MIDSVKILRALPLNTAEIVNLSDMDIQYVFTESSDIVPYVLPDSGLNDQRPFIYIAMFGMITFGLAYWFINRKRSSKKRDV